MVNDWKTGVKSKGNCILFKLVGFELTRFRKKGFLLQYIDLFLLFLVL